MGLLVSFIVEEGIKRFIVLIGSFFIGIIGELFSVERGGGGLIFDLRKRLDLRWPDFDSSFSGGLLSRIGQVFDRWISRLIRFDESFGGVGLISRRDI